MSSVVFSCIAPVNIALIKYWGKRDEKLILPINDSISATLSTDELCAKTTVMASPNFNENRFWLNGIEQDFNNERLENCLKEVKKRANSKSPQFNWHIHICSENNFPTAAGLASSAAGYACLVSALSALYQIEGDRSRIARQGSGSACRSIFGGWVQWHSGVLPDGSDSIATQLFPADHWPQMRILILVVNDQKKSVSSSLGMKISVQTSELLKFRAEKIVPRRTKEITEAIRNRNFNEFAKLTMQESNQFHAVCLDTFPPISYMNETSFKIIKMVHSYNQFFNENKIAYTFDAGPNACLYLLEENVDQTLALINEVFPPTLLKSENFSSPLRPELKNNLELPERSPGSVKYIIQTKVGNGPVILTDPSLHLLDEQGLPKKKL